MDHAGVAAMTSDTTLSRSAELVAVKRCSVVNTRPDMRQGSLLRLMWSIGPELISAASDNDPTNVGTGAVAGARAGYRLSWLALLASPLLVIVLTIAAQVSPVGQQGLRSLTLKRYGGRPSHL